MALVRVYELAKELGVESRTILWHLTALDAPAISASSQVHPTAVRAVRERVAAGIAPSASSGHIVERLSRGPSPRFWDDDERPDPSELLGAGRAAREAGVVPATVRQWVARGHLQRADTTTSGRALYRRGDVTAAARTASERTRRAPAPQRVDPRLMCRPVTAAEAASIVGVSPSTIRMWVHRGHLHPVDPSRPMRFDPMVVLKVARRRAAPRRGPRRPN